MVSHLEKSFAKIGAKFNLVSVRRRDPQGRRSKTRSMEIPVQMDIIEKNGEEQFEIAIRSDLADQIEVSILELRPEDRHLVLLARQIGRDGQAVSKDHFLCGHDERHFFVAAVEGVSTVAAAKASLKPELILEQEAGLNSAKRNRRKTPVYVRQGEWFFVPAQVNPDEKLIRRNEPLRRGNGSKAHMAQFAYRRGGESVKVCSAYPNGLTYKEYKKLIEEKPAAARFAWKDMQRNAEVFVRGRISHADHATVVLDTWHRVFMNRERQVAAVAFLD